jgi:hypothetical protein
MENNNVLPTDIKLPKETIAELNKLGSTLESGQKALDALKKMGLDVTVLQNQLDVATNQRKVMLEAFK